MPIITFASIAVRGKAHGTWNAGALRFVLPIEPCDHLHRIELIDHAGAVYELHERPRPLCGLVDDLALDSGQT